jgi:diacylglycerol kinase family enzyme
LRRPDQALRHDGCVASRCNGDRVPHPLVSNEVLPRACRSHRAPERVLQELDPKPSGESLAESRDAALNGKLYPGMRLAAQGCLDLHAPAQIAAKEISVIVNKRSGAEGAPDAQALRAVLAEAGLQARLNAFEAGEDIRSLARKVLKDRPPVLVAAGGDGTVSAVADVVRDTGTALGVMPVGTLNHFAKDLGIALDLTEAARTIARGRRIRVDVAEVNGRAFINNASLGLYPNIVRERTRQQRRFGRSKRTAMLWASLEVLHRSRLLDLRLELADGVQECRAPFVFIGNNDYILEGFDIGKRERLDAGILKVYTTRCASPAGLFGLALRALLGRLRQADDFMEASARSLRVQSRHKRLLVATDGELNAMDTPLDFGIRPRSLQVIVP